MQPCDLGQPRVPVVPCRVAEELVLIICPGVFLPVIATMVLRSTDTASGTYVVTGLQGGLVIAEGVPECCG